MLNELHKLIDVGSQALCPLPLNFREQLVNLGVADMEGACEIYRCCNGFYAFEASLHVFPVRTCNGTIGLDEWNSVDGWRSRYGDLVHGCVFLAEDIFGTQFCIKEDGVFSFDPETGALTYLAEDLNGWAKVVLEDYDLLTGYPLGHKWQAQYGPIPPGMRLVPKIPFVLGGEYSIDNLHAANCREAMAFRAEIAVHIRNLPDGEKLRLRVTD